MMLAEPSFGNRLLLACLRAPVHRVLLVSIAAMTLVTATDWWVGLNLSLGALYVLPTILAATVLSFREIFLFAASCGILRLVFNPPNSLIESILGFALGTIAYAGSGFFVAELVRNRKLALRHVEEMQEQQVLRREAEEQLRILVESSPAAIMTVDSQGQVLVANRAAEDLLVSGEGGSLVGRDIGEHLPVLADALKLDGGAGEFRTAAQCRGKRRTGEVFIAHTWFSTYLVGDQRRLAAIAVDISEEMREVEERNLRTLLRSNRIIAGAVSHDIRNFCSAVRVACTNLGVVEGLRNNEDFQALGALVDGLGRIAATELKSRTQEELSAVDLLSVLAHLRIVIEPGWTEIDGQIEWNMPAQTTLVVGESTGLLQAFLNLAHNSRRAVQACTHRTLSIEVLNGNSRVTVRFRDSGPGIPKDMPLFQPFQPGAEASGMGLFISRAAVRSYGGDLKHEPSSDGCCFAVELRPAR